MGLRDRQRRKLEQSAAKFIEAGERIRFVVAGQTAARPGSVRVVAGAKARVVAGTDEAVYLLEGSPWSVTRSTGVRARIPLPEAAMELHRDGPATVLDIAEERIRLGNFTDEDLDAVRSLASR